MNSKQKGFSPIIILVLIVVIGAVAAAGFFVLSNQKDETSSSSNESSEISEESSNQTETALADITRSFELSPICEGSSFPSNVTASDTGTRIAQFLERVDVDGEYNNSGSVYLPAEYRIGDNEVAVDYVSCLARSDSTASEKVCEFNGDTQATMNINNYELTIYSSADGSKVVDGQEIIATQECPSVATIRDGEFFAEVDEDAYEVAVMAAL